MIALAKLERRGMPDEFLNLPRQKQIKRYRDLAEIARAEAEHAAGPARDTYLRIAAQFEQRATRTAERINPSTDQPGM